MEINFNKIFELAFGHEATPYILKTDFAMGYGKVDAIIEEKDNGKLWHIIIIYQTHDNGKSISVTEGAGTMTLIE